MTWIKVEDELPIQCWTVKVRNGKNVYYAQYYRRKWRCFGLKLHKVTEWEKCPVTYPKIPQKDMKAYLKRAEKYRSQMQPKNFVTRPIWGLYHGNNLNPQPVAPAEELNRLEKELIDG